MDAEFAPDRPEFFLGDPHTVFRRLRREDPLPLVCRIGGAWCLLKHADILEVSRDPARFTSTRGIQVSMTEVERRPSQVARTILEMDPPEHNRYRKLVIRAFTPGATLELETMVRQIARECLETVRPGEVMDLVDRLAVPLPMYVIAEMLGVPRSDRPNFKRWSDSMIEAGGGRRSPATDASLVEMLGYFQRHLAERRRARTCSRSSRSPRSTACGSAIRSSARSA
jgi:cytochrome P450